MFPKRYSQIIKPGTTVGSEECFFWFVKKIMITKQVFLKVHQRLQTSHILITHKVSSYLEKPTSFQMGMTTNQSAKKAAPWFLANAGAINIIIVFTNILSYQTPAFWSYLTYSPPL
jgi:hypothetical protein